MFAKKWADKMRPDQETGRTPNLLVEERIMVYKALMSGRTAISSANVETLARKHVEDARAEADKLKDDAQTEAKIDRKSVV